MLEKINFFNLKGNIWKMLIFKLTSRRNFISILSIYFLTFPDNNIKQLGLYTGIGSIAGFLLEIPSGYFSDIFGHKRTLILAKICLIISTGFFLIWWDWWIFALGSVFLSFGFALNSGTDTAILHETLEELWEEKKFTKINSRIGGNASLISIAFIVAIPFFTKISFKIPFLIWLGFDALGILVALSLIQPKIVKKTSTATKKFMKIIKEILKQKQLRNVMFYAAFLGGILLSSSAFRWVYLESIGYPVILIWLVMWLSRFVWFLVSRVTHWIEDKFSIKQIMWFEVFLFSIAFASTALIPNPYIVAGIFSVIVWYFWGRSTIFTHYTLNNLPDKTYKATALSVGRQMSDMIRLVLVFVMGYVMDFWSFEFGFLVVAILFFVSLGMITLLHKRES